jgi:tRNA A-37 threonylcarbamoyl transferase component Bud32
MFDAMNVQVGDVLAGKYRVERVLGAGGMGVVVAAQHLQLGQRVALKFLKLEAASDVSVKRFVREARAAAQIRGEHVARISDVGTLDDGSPFMVMELLEGRDLGNELIVRGALPVAQCIDYVLQACEAVAEAHAAGVIHRDLKPSNLFLTHRPGGAPLIKVLDFGISKIVGGAGEDKLEPSLTGTSTLLGSPRYMSPEQLRGTKNVDVRTDVWALGVILYELLSGTIPFEADTLPGLLAQIAADPPRPILDVCPHLPEGLAAIIMRCLEKDTTRRFGNVGELSVALLPYAAAPSRVSVERILAILSMSPLAVSGMTAQPPTATVTIPGAVLRGAITPNTATSFGHTGGGAKVVRANRAIPWLVALPALLLMIGAGWFALRALRPEPQGSDSPPKTTATAIASAPVAAVETNEPDAAARSPAPAVKEDLPAALAESAKAAPSATSAPVEPRRVAAPAAAPKPPVRRPSNPVRSAPLSNILDGRE